MTPTSTTPARPRSEAGFTLIELMLTVFIVGLLGSAIVLALPGREPGLGREADAFAARLERAKEEAILTNRTVDVAIDRAGYRFRAQSPTGLVEMTEPPFAPVVWGEGLRVRLETADGAQVVRFDATGAAAPASIALERRARTIDVKVDEAGNVTLDAARS